MAPSLVSDYAFEHCKARAMGRVHSVYATSMNVDVNGFLLHVGSDLAPLSCLGMTIAPGDMENLLSCVKRGDRAVFNNGLMRLYGRYGIGEIEIRPARVCSCSVPPLGVGALQELGPTVFDALDEFGLPALTGLPDCARSKRALSELSRYASICARAASDGGVAHQVKDSAARRALIDAVEYLVGRGLGLTPSGDDILCGFGCGLTFLYGKIWPQGCSYYRDVVAEAIPGKTTAVSEAYLKAMIDAYANADYLDILDALATGNMDALPALFETTLSVGHTSGADGLLGFAAAFCCLL